LLKRGKGKSANHSKPPTRQLAEKKLSVFRIR